MAKVTTSSPVRQIHGKTSKNEKGYYYVTATGDQKFRVRPETYQQKRSPKQLWHTESFVWAHKQIRNLWSDGNEVAQITQDWKDAMRRDAQGKLYADAKGWKYAQLQQQWKSEHPFESWYETYLQNLSAQAAEKTASAETSEYMLRHQIELLSAQIDELRSRLNNR